MVRLIHGRIHRAPLISCQPHLGRTCAGWRKGCRPRTPLGICLAAPASGDEGGGWWRIVVEVRFGGALESPTEELPKGFTFSMVLCPCLYACMAMETFK
jgi:hypothetical protein